MILLIVLIMAMAGCNDHADSMTNSSSESLHEYAQTHLSVSNNSMEAAVGFDITVEELQPIINNAFSCYTMMYFGGEQTFNNINGTYISDDGQTIEEYFQMFFDTFSKSSNKAEEYVASLVYSSSLTDKNGMLCVNTKHSGFEGNIIIDYKNIPDNYSSISFVGGSGTDPMFIDNYFTITEREENKIILKNTAFYSENNGWSYYDDNNNLVLLTVGNKPGVPSSTDEIKEFYYTMVLEEGKWKFETFERWC